MTTAATEPIWLVTPQKVDAAVRRLIEVGRPRKIILFGSYVRGEITRDSDLDVLVVTSDDVEDTRQESVRLRSAMRGILSGPSHCCGREGSGLGQAKDCCVQHREHMRSPTNNPEPPPRARRWNISSNP